MSGPGGLPREFGRFLLVGGLATAVHYAALLVGVEIFGRTPVLASGIGACLGAVTGYLLNRAYTFRSAVPHRTGALRFGTVALVGLGLNQLLMMLLTGRLGWHYVLAQVLATGTVLVWNFAGNRFWTFRGH